LPNAASLAGATAVSSVTYDERYGLGHARARAAAELADRHVRVELTGDDDLECVRIWIHGYTHYLHSTTARELEKMLGKCLDDYNKVAEQNGMPSV
jgi:hypothetical protein